ncbi:hypothetical protein P171DRAFT_138454 [Karstenula rhodostoma CBS 690.94]|uniref:Uncharacterized protein n=1 Tax=Karstenula rhodostoma CBS 690.94 TaxID=1392251 RepID=A0A9P4PU60_9PLEO|nr:hypothetical protein P171DRAFT_138454 [Karstenula rhodostoma CBS 690.94]
MIGIWTLQEAVLARHSILCYGKDEVSWQGRFQTLKKIIFRIKAGVIAPHFGPGGCSSLLDWSPFVQVLETQMRQAFLASYKPCFNELFHA